MATTNSNFKVKNNLEVLGTGTSTVAGALQIAGAITGITTAAISGQVTSTVSTGTAPLIIASTTLVSNLNVQYLNSQLGSYYLDLANATGTLAAARFPALTGDVTTTIGTVATTIIAGAVTLAKMADVATGTVFYRKTAATGVPEVQTLATLKTDLGLTGTNSGDQTITLTGNVTGSGTGSFATTIAAGVVTLAMQANVATGTVFYRKTAATGVPEVQTLATLKTDLGLTGTNSGDQTITLTSDVTGSGTGSFVATIANSAVTLAKMANITTSSLIGRSTAGTGVPEVLTIGAGLTIIAGVLNTASTGSGTPDFIIQSFGIT